MTTPHQITKTRPQVYAYVTTEGNSDYEIVSGDIHVIWVNWEKLDWNYFSDYQPEDFLSDWRELGQIAHPKVRARERSSYLSLFHERAQSLRDDRKQAAELEHLGQQRKLEEARALLRATGELP